MIHLTPAVYTVMPWANGKGTTTELCREDRDGVMLWRLSRAAVVEDGPFSLFPGINRNLTVISGPGFELAGAGIWLAARPFQPVAFSGDVPVRAEGVTAPSDDFNVMVSCDLPPAIVIVTSEAQRITPLQAGLIGIYALEPVTVDGKRLAPADLALSRLAMDKAPGLAIVVHIRDGGVSQILNQP